MPLNLTFVDMLAFGKGNSIYAKAFQELIAISRQGHHAADLAIDYPNFRTAIGLYIFSPKGKPVWAVFENSLDREGRYMCQG